MNPTNYERAVRLFWLMRDAGKKVPQNETELLIFAKQCSLASQEIERLLNEREPEVTKGK